MHDFWGEVGYNSYLCLSTDKAFFFPVFFQDSFFIFDFLQFEYNMLRYKGFGAFILIGILWASRICGVMSDINLEKFSVIITSKELLFKEGTSFSNVTGK